MHHDQELDVFWPVRARAAQPLHPPCEGADSGEFDALP